MKRYRRIALALGIVACGLALSACGSDSAPRYADNLGPGYVKVGSLFYQVQISRELNPFSDEDSAYLQGMPKGSLPAGQIWFGVFIQAYNTTTHQQTPASDYYITDALGAKFTPVTNPTPNAFTYQARVIPPKGQLPSDTSLAFSSWTQGEALLFEFPYTTYNSRPLILHIVDPLDPLKESRIELDV